MFKQLENGIAAETLKFMLKFGAGEGNRTLILRLGI